MRLEQIRHFAAEAHKTRYVKKGPQLYHAFKIANSEQHEVGFAYAYHLRHVELVSLRYGFEGDLVTRAACWLHDILEDTDVTSQELHLLGINPAVIDIVERVTDGPGNNRAERKADMYPRCQQNPLAIVVKLCDRIANMEETLKSNKTGLWSMYCDEHVEFVTKMYSAKHGQYESEIVQMVKYLDIIYAQPSPSTLYYCMTCKGPSAKVCIKDRHDVDYGSVLKVKVPK